MQNNISPIFLYPLLIPHIIKLCIKYRSSISIITKANPAFILGGLPFTPKDSIFNLFQNKILPYLVIKKNDLDKKKKINLFIKNHRLPVIVKPNTSHRGIDVSLIKSKKSLIKLLDSQQWDYQIQKYDDSAFEFGIFYVRFPNQKKGEIVSLTEKKIPILKGDGKNTFETLINKSDFDDKKRIKKIYKKKLSTILKKDQVEKLTISACRSRGVNFYDRKNWITEDLKKTVEDICHIDGFYFGRMDVKAKSIDAFKKGSFKIIEINGATSEFIHIWDKRYNLKEGLSELKTQWSLLFFIANQNKTDPKVINISFLSFLKKYINFFLLTKKITGKLW